MNEHILFCDESPLFRTPVCPATGDTVTLRFRTAAGDAECVYLVRGEERIAMNEQRSPAGKASRISYWETSLLFSGEEITYHFEILRNGEVWLYNRQGPVWVCEEADEFRIAPDAEVPAWAKGRVFYQIFVDRFANGDPTNDVRSCEYEYLDSPVCHEDIWDAPVTVPDVGRFYGGDLQGVIDKLDYLQELGIGGIYLNPIFVSPSNHKYDAQDYSHVDPHFGRIVHDGDYVCRSAHPDNLAASDALLAKLIREAHKRDIRVLLDGVFNHCGSFHRWLDREGIYAEAAAREISEETAPGAYHSADSPYRSFFRFADEEAWPDNDSYEGWWDHKTLPKLNYEDAEALQQEILRVAQKWVSPPYNADGWRLDVAADLGHSPAFNHEFWRRFRKAVHEARPDALILAEHYGYAGEWLRGGQWHSVMNYDAFMEPLSWLLTGMEKHSEHAVPELRGDVAAFRETVRRANAALGTQALQVAMNQLDNHDHSRFLTRTTHTAGRLEELGSEAASAGAEVWVLRQAVLVQMAWPGMPTLYYGDEAGLAGFTDPDNRRPFPWGNEDADLVAFYKCAIAMHRRYEVLREGSLVQVPCLLPGEEQNEVPGVLAFGRFDAKEAVLTVLGTGHEHTEAVIPLAPLGVEEGNPLLVFFSDADGWTDNEQNVEAIDNCLHLQVAPGSAAVYYSVLRNVRNRK